jgi:antitoxin YefM
MQAVNYSHARNNLKSLIDEVCENDEEVIITTKNDKSVVMISLDEYNRTHTQIKKDVVKALKQIEQGDFMSIEKAFEKAKNSYRD